MLKGVAGRKPQTPPTNAKASRSNGPTIVPTSNSAGLKAGSGALEGDPDQPLGAFTDDNGAPSEVGLSVKSRAGGDKIRPRHRGIHPGSSMYDWR
jgi:hypothetical protein